MRNTIRRIGLVAGALFLSVAASAYAGGANSSGPYDVNAGQGFPSLNGNGNGNGNNGLAVGKPAAGTVGNADDKNPPGQVKRLVADPSNVFFPYSDPDNGYECDGNSGIALGNPAHSGCFGLY